MKKYPFFLLILIFLFLLAGCSGAETAPPTEAPTEPPVADIGGMLVDYGATGLDLSSGGFSLDKLIDAASQLKSIGHINLGATELTGEDFLRLQAAYPAADISYTLSLFGQTLTKDTQTLDASTMTADQTDMLLDRLAFLPALQEINLVSAEGVCVYDLQTIGELDKLHAALPEAYLRVSFDLFGQKVTSEDERIEYNQVPIGNEGIETVRAVLPYLRSCTYFLMDGCGVDNEVMARLREDFPDTKIVWRVWLVEEDYNSKLFLRCGSYLTDTHRIRTTYVNDRNSHVLNYCTETKYVDVGHVWALTQCEFLSYMPDLEVCIIAITEITDIAPLANHDKLEYLELFTTDISDLTPLISCPNIEHLNLSNMPLLKDISPIYGLTKLKRLRMVDSPLIPEAQKQEIAQLLPDCAMLNQGHFPTAWFWRYEDAAKTIKVERYALLCEQMEYEKDAIEYGIP